MKTWIIKAIDVQMRDARMPFWKLTREVQAATKAEALAKAGSVLHSNCVVKSVSAKRP